MSLRARGAYTENIGSECDGMTIPHNGIDNLKQHWFFLQYRLISTFIYDFVDHLNFIFVKHFKHMVETLRQMFKTSLCHLYVSFLH